LRALGSERGSGTKTKKDTVNEALRRVVEQETRQRHVDELADKSVWVRLTKPAVKEAVASRVDRGLVGTCPIIDLEILYSARTGNEHDHFRSQRAIEVQGLLAQRAAQVGFDPRPADRRDT